MPGETHQRGRTAEADTATRLFCSLVNDDDGMTGVVVLADRSRDIAGLSDLSDGLREALVDGAARPEMDLGEFDLQMTVSEPAWVMESLPARAGSRRDDAR